MNPVDAKKKNAAWHHDPLGKQDAAWYRGTQGRGHAAFARHLDELMLGEEQGGAEAKQADSGAVGGETGHPQGVSRADVADPAPTPAADRWAASADRPQLGHGGQVFVRWRGDGLVTHPLDDALLVLLPADRTLLRPGAVMEAMSTALAGVVKRLAVGTPPDALPERVFRWFWRGMLPHLSAHPPAGVDPLLWGNYLQLAPADTRCPDHGLADHVRTAAALAPSDGLEPWLFSLDMGGVQAWLRQTRTSRDLWVTSMLFAELSFAAMQPILDAHGPDAVLYPDLRHNVRHDRALDGAPDAADLLRAEERAQRTRAALVPNHWLALLPGTLSADELRKLGEACRSAAVDRWLELAREVRDQFFRDGPGRNLSPDEQGRWRKTWTDQVERRGEVPVYWAARRWAAAPFDVPEPQPAPALPGQTGQYEAWKAWRKQSDARLQEYEAGLGEATLQRYDRVAWTSVTVLQGGAAAGTTRSPAQAAASQPGFEYALHWHMLSQVLAARSQARTLPANPAPAGVVCTVCGERAALGGGEGTADQQRGKARDAWAEIARGFGWDQGGAERLCGVCATRRFLIPPWESPTNPLEQVGATGSFHRVWAFGGDVAVDKGQHTLRLPMPSTAAVASAPFLIELAKDDSPAARTLRTELLAWADRNRWPQTFFPRSLPAVGGSLEERNTADTPRFDWLEPSIYHHGPRLAELTAATLAERGGAPNPMVAAEDAKARAIVNTYLDHVRKHGRRPPATKVAVLTMDGDNLGALLKGEASAVHARWRDVLHPDAARRIEDEARDGVPWAQAWLRLLDEPRLVGPGLHSFLNRALTTFANRIVPWVVEQEFRGRLVYAGGDDVLALCPAEDALAIAARLQQLWSAAWVLDTDPARCAWAPPDQQGALRRWDPDAAQARFRVFQARAVGGRGQSALFDPQFAPHTWTEQAPEPGALGQVLPMLGAHQSLSAGIAYGHFKTPMQLLVEEAREALERAKRRQGKASVGESLFTRGGAKYRSAFGWGSNQERVRRVRDLRRAFDEDDLPGRLPYKLQGHNSAFAALGEGKPEGQRRLERLQLARGLVLHAMDRESGGESDEIRARRADALADLWAEDDLGNLLLCRALGAEEDE